MNLRLPVYYIRKYWLNFPQALNLIATISTFVRGKISRRYHIPTSPLVLMVEPTNRCNFSCPLCDKGSGRIAREEGAMTLEQFSRLIDEVSPRLKMLLLWNQGEPLLNQQLSQMIRRAKSRKTFCLFSTNGSLLLQRAEEIVSSGLDEIIISLDGADQTTFQRYRQGGDFTQILQGIRKLVEVRGRKFTPLISLQFLLLKHNLHQMGRFHEFARELGVDRVVFKTVQVSSSEEAQEFLPPELKYTRYTDAKSLRLRRKRQDCRRLLYSAVVDWNGNVVPCCFDKDEAFVVGNILEQPFLRIWQGENFARFRQLIADGNRPLMCFNCTEGVKKIFL